MTENAALDRYRLRVETLEYLGDRGSATRRERRAAEILSDELRDIGFEDVRLEPFVGCDSMGQRLFLHAFAGLIGAILVWVAPLAAIPIGLTALFSLIIESSTRVDLLSATLVNKPSQNVVAIHRVSAGTPRKRVVVMGHYDTQRTGWIWADALQGRAASALAKAPGLLKSPMFPVLLALTLVPLAGVLQLFGWLPLLSTVLSVVAVILTGLASALLAQWGWGPYVPGANDNATGACAVLSLAERWRAAPIDDVEVVFVATGCEETGLTGAAAWAEEHAAAMQRTPTVFVNLDSLGYGHPIFLGKEYSLAGLPYAYPKEAVACAAEVAAELGLTDAGPHTTPVATDGLAFLARNVPGVSILAWVGGGHMPNYHQLTDTADRISFEVAWACVEFADGVIRRLAAK